MNTFSPLRVIGAWLLLCGFVFLVLDAIATRPVAIFVEVYRTQNMSDQDVLTRAAQEAMGQEANGWWIHDRRPYLVFDARRTYDVTSSFYQSLRLELDSPDGQLLLGRIRMPEAGP